MTDSAELVDRIRQLITDEGYVLSDRLPAERDLCKTLGVTRHQLRSALICLEKNGLIWRHVGRGTFVGPRPVLNIEEVAYLRELVSPAQMVEVRISIEPELAGLAARNATAADLEQMKTCAERCESAVDWRGYEAWDTNLHHAIARASHNKLYLYFFETLNVVRRSFFWGQTRTTTGPAKDYSSFLQHRQVVEAIEARDATAAGDAMRDHLKSVYSRLFPVANVGHPAGDARPRA
ncbi:FadR/GntR family transcriptional regulator [Tropicimonas sp. S265A]|uniref:FadR/GntR family transcriptional regulator n=1 Tax=Tropicimonas sp. S265A TaxID=3415134 RepID=UPI003C7E6696